jgi:hypothetical protein
MTTKQGGISVKIQANQIKFKTLVAAFVLTVAGMLCAAPMLLAQVNPPATSAVNLYPAGVGFFDQFVGTIGPAQIVTLTNNGTAALSITKIVASAGFSQTNSCRPAQ